MLRVLMLAAGFAAAGASFADTPEQILEGYTAQARTEEPGFAGFSVERGEAFYREPHVIKVPASGAARRAI
jgi:hypothetical protein